MLDVICEHFGVVVSFSDVFQLGWVVPGGQNLALVLLRLEKQGIEKMNCKFPAYSLHRI